MYNFYLSLLIAHHAGAGNHVYGRLLSTYASEAHLNAMRVLGLTASPAFSAKNAMETLQLLESRLHARVVLPKSISTASPSVSQQTIRYDPADDAPISARCFHVVSPVPSMDVSQRQVLKHAQDVYRELGARGALRWIEVHHGSLHADQSGRIAEGVVVNDEMKESSPSLLRPEHSSESLFSRSLRRMHSMWKTENRFHPFSAKMRKLLELLRNENQRSDAPLPRVLLHTKQIAVGQALTLLLNEVMKGLVTAEFFQGTNASAVKNSSLIELSNTYSQLHRLQELNSNTLAQVRSLLYRFNCGDVNLLVATSAAEEGIDIANCNMVILFSGVQNVKRCVVKLTIR